VSDMWGINLSNSEPWIASFGGYTWNLVEMWSARIFCVLGYIGLVRFSRRVINRR